MLCTWLAGTILGIGLGIDGGAQFLGNLGAEISDSALDLSQEAGQFVVFRWLSLVVGLLILSLLVRRLLVLQGSCAVALTAVSVRVWTLRLIVLLGTC